MSPCGWVVASSPWRRGRHRPGGAQECTQIGKNGPSVPFRGICVHCCAVGLGCGWPWDHNSVHKWKDRASPHRIGAFVYTVGLLRCCGQTWGRRSVHRLAKMASWARFGSFVYTVAPPVAPPVATQAATQAAAAGASDAAASLALQASRGGRVVTESAVSCWVYLELSSIHADGGEAP